MNSNQVTSDLQPETQRLAEAFRVFSQASAELSDAYTRLEEQVAALTAELAAANGALRQQYLEKAALTERLSLLLDALPAGVVVLDAAGVLVQANPAAEAILGAGLNGSYWQTIESERLIPSDTPHEYLTGEHPGRRVAITISPLVSAGGAIVLLHDITEAHHLKAQVERNERLAAMGEMAAQLAHQLRTPLAAALLYTGNLDNPGLAASVRTAIAQKAVARLKHLERLIQDTLHFARGEVLGQEPVVLEELLRELRQTIEPLARARGVALEVRSQRLPAVYPGNHKALVGALTNLLENALHAAAGGDAPASVVLAVDAEDSGLRFCVRDSGRGMTPVVAARLFEPFFTTRADGTGLGLAIARGVARAHGGDIEVASTIGTGAELIFTLPPASVMPGTEEIGTT